jgi:hypothetical protein
VGKKKTPPGFGLAAYQRGVLADSHQLLIFISGYSIVYPNPTYRIREKGRRHTGQKADLITDSVDRLLPGHPASAGPGGSTAAAGPGLLLKVNVLHC